MAQEHMNDWMQTAKDLARAERELKIERWVYITFEYRNEDRSRVILHKIDIPVSLYARWRWLIDWRQAKLVCLYPRKNVRAYYSYYDKRSGLKTGFNTLLSRLIAAKAQITKVKRRIDAYITDKRQNDLFFDTATDPLLLRAQRKLTQKTDNFNLLYNRLHIEVEKLKNKSIPD